MSLLRAVVFMLFTLCVTTTVRSHPRSLKIVNSYPINGSQYVHPLSNIGINFSLPLDPNRLPVDSISVFGENNRKYEGSLKLSKNHKTLIFMPSEHFYSGDIIHVRIGSFSTPYNEISAPFFLNFSVRNKFSDPITDEQNQNGGNTSSSYPTLPQTMPQFNILVDNKPSEGLMYVNGINQGARFSSILGKNGNIVKIFQRPQPFMDADFKPNPNGTYSYFDGKNQIYYILDTNFSVIDSVIAPPAYFTDFHEIRFTSEGNRIIIGLDTETVDMSNQLIGGDTSATVIIPSILVIDQDNNLIWVWKATDPGHFKVTDATHEVLTYSRIDFCHMNSIEFDADSNLIITCRNMDENTKIDRETGNIIWRWGGNNNQFTLVGDSIPFSHQHATRRTPEGTYTMLDDGDFRPGLLLPYSRAVEYRLDTINHTATKIWEFRHNPDIAAEGMGSVQRLPNKNTLIDWGNALSVGITEVDSENITRFEMAMPSGSFSYRAYKYDSNYIHSNIQKASVNSASTSKIKISVQPNPVTDAAKIELNLEKDEYIDLTLLDILGREVLKIYSGFLSQGSHEFALNSPSLVAGSYFLSIRPSGLSATQMKIMIVK